MIFLIWLHHYILNDFKKCMKEKVEKDNRIILIAKRCLAILYVIVTEVLVKVFRARTVF